MLYLGLYLSVAAILMGVLAAMDADDLVPAVPFWPITLPFVLLMMLGFFVANLFKGWSTK